MYTLRFVYDVILGQHYELVPMEPQTIDVKTVLSKYTTTSDVRRSARANNGKHR